MPTFVTHGPFEIPVYKGKAARTVTADQATEFWKRHPAYAKARGWAFLCFPFGGRGSALYFGISPKGFRQEVFQPHKLTKYQQGLADYLKGKPVLFFLTPPVAKGATNVTSINELEAFLIQTAVSKNPELLNVKGTKKEEWAIAGVVRSGVGKPSKAAKALKGSLGI